MVAAVLGCEMFTDEAMHAAMARQMIELASIIWLAPSLLIATLGASLATKSRLAMSAFVGAEMIACFRAKPGSLVLIALAAYLISAVQLARRTKPQDTERAIALALIVGNVATFALMMIVGVDNAYANDVVSTSNNLTHLVVSALGLWAMQTR